MAIHFAPIKTTVPSVPSNRTPLIKYNIARVAKRVVNYGAYLVGRIAYKGAMTKGIYNAAADLIGIAGKDLCKYYHAGYVRSIISHERSLVWHLALAYEINIGEVKGYERFQLLYRAKRSMMAQQNYIEWVSFWASSEVNELMQKFRDLLPGFTMPKCYPPYI